MVPWRLILRSRSASSPRSGGDGPRTLTLSARARGSPRSGGDGPVSSLPGPLGSVFSPLRRGWSLDALASNQIAVVLPAQAGMVPSPRPMPEARPCSPRSGGDGPPDRGGELRFREFSPLRRGWSGAGIIDLDDNIVLPAQAGMVRCFSKDTRPKCGSPRSGGDGPPLTAAASVAARFSPLRRGWSVLSLLVPAAVIVLPTQAGMVPPTPTGSPSPQRSPRSGGDGPAQEFAGTAFEVFSPLRRGWSPAYSQRVRWGLVLPAQAGMVPPPPAAAHPRWRSPRSGGDGPSLWGVRGTPVVFSPLRRGWSQARWRWHERCHVLPAQAGMVRTPGPSSTSDGCSPRSGGDGPQSILEHGDLIQFSPLRRGWS